VLQLRFQGIAGSAAVGHLMTLREGVVKPHDKSVGLRSVLNLKLDDSEADVEVFLDSVRTERQDTISFSYFV
jgi:hypothetical protein